MKSAPLENPEIGTCSSRTGNGIESVKTNAPGATVVDLSD
ncbi:DUF1508 domain-containing protein [Mycobacterium sp. BK086]